MAWKLGAIVCLMVVPLLGLVLVYAAELHQRLDAAKRAHQGLEVADAVWPLAFDAAGGASPAPEALERLHTRLDALDVAARAETISAIRAAAAVIAANESRQSVLRATRQIARSLGDLVSSTAAADQSTRKAVELSVESTLHLLAVSSYATDAAITPGVRMAILSILITHAREQADRLVAEADDEGLANRLYPSLVALEDAGGALSSALMTRAPREEVTALRDAFVQALNGFRGAAHAEAERMAHAHRAALHSYSLLVAGVIAALFVFGLGGAAWVARSILFPHRELVSLMRRLVEGETRILVPYRRRPDEVGDWARAVEVFRAALIERQMLELDLAAERDALEQRVRERTRALAEAREAAEAANAAKSAFLAAMSHEIRTPLNGVLGMAAALERTELADRQREMLNVITESGGVLLTLLNDVLDLSKIEAGRLELERAPFQLSACVKAVLALYSESAEAKGLFLHLAVGPDTPDWLVGDATRLRQILQNLVSNAIKFTEKGGVTLTVRCVANEGPPVVRFEVMDTGIGMTPEQTSRLFQKFVQADVSTTRRYGGTGLGLAICRELTTLMGGELSVRSAPGQGSTFWLCVPFEAAAGAPTGKRALAEEAAAAPGAEILAADDNAMNRRVISTILQQAGVRVALAENGEAAVKLAALRRFDAIVLDLHMPVMDGLDAARAIRASGGPNATTPIIALSADVSQSRQSQTHAAGMDRFVGKPFRAADLMQAVAEAIAARADAADVRAVG